MVDWEFWGNKTALQVIGVGFLIVVTGIALALFVNTYFIIIAIIGLLLMGAAGGYLYTWENWDLLKKSKGTSTELTREEEALLKDEFQNLRE